MLRGTFSGGAQSLPTASTFAREDWCVGCQKNDPLPTYAPCPFGNVCHIKPSQDNNETALPPTVPSSLARRYTVLRQPLSAKLRCPVLLM